MASSVYTLIVRGCTVSADGGCSKSSIHKFELIASRFSTLKAFKAASADVYNNFKTVEGRRCFRPLNEKETMAIERFKRVLNPKKSVEENFIRLLVGEFIRKQLEMLDSISIDKLNSNPMLCKALNFRTVEELVRYNAYAAITRSIVTSMGFLIQDLLLYSSSDAYDGKGYEEGKDTKFDIVIERLGNIRSYIELKSGPNDLDSAQVKHYAKEIAAVEASGYKGFIGISYGRRDGKYVSLGLLEKYLPDWNAKTLIGQELWDYVSGNPGYHKALLDCIEKTARLMLGRNSLLKKIEARIKELTTSFKETYPSLEDYYATLW